MNIRQIMQPSAAVFNGAKFVLALGLAGCAMMEPLEEKHLQQEVQDPRSSVVLFRYTTRGPTTGDILPGSRGWRHLVIAVSNESTGWNFRRLDDSTMIFHTRDDSVERDEFSADAGWITFVAPPGRNYVAVTSRAAARNSKNWEMIDFIDTPRFVVQVPRPRSLIYAGTIVRTLKCGWWGCPYDLTVLDESTLARTFVDRYRKNFPPALLQTQLLMIPQSRTIKIQGGPAERD